MPAEPDHALALRISAWLKDNHGKPVMIDIGTHDPDREPCERFYLTISTRLGRNYRSDVVEDPGVIVVNVTEEPGVSMFTIPLGGVEDAKFDDGVAPSLTIHFEDAGCLSLLIAA